MFDGELNTQTTATSPLTVVVDPGAAINSLAFLELEGSQLVVTATDGSGGPTVYTKTINLDSTEILDWYMYFFEPFSFVSEIVLTDIPPYYNIVITASLTGSGTVKMGSMIYGTSYYLGGTQYGASSGIRDFSVKQTDDFGNVTFVQRAYSKRMDVSLFMENTDLVYKQKLLASLRAVPCVWIGVDDSIYNNLTVFGYYRDFNIDISYPSHSICKLEIEGLI